MLIDNFVLPMPCKEMGSSRQQRFESEKVKGVILSRTFRCLVMVTLFFGTTVTIIFFFHTLVKQSTFILPAHKDLLIKLINNLEPNLIDFVRLT